MTIAGCVLSKIKAAGQKREKGTHAKVEETEE